MFIELTDHLRCPADHAEQYLVLLPDRIVERSVMEGRLGCPVCGRTWPVVEGVAELGGPPPGVAAGAAFDPAAMHVLLGLSGPGGYAALVGSAAEAWPGLAAELRGVALVAVNPPPGIADAAPALSVVRAPLIPLKARSLRGVVLGADVAGDLHWVREAARATLPGLRVVGRGPEPDLPELELLASAEGTWVAARR
ncbi:MAG: Trm112 family protein [Deltaproteobacteria bacterium]